MPAYDVAEEIGRTLIDDFAAGRSTSCYCAYTDFRSAFTLRATAQAVPADRARGGRRARARRPCTPSTCSSRRPSSILDHLLPQYLITKVYAALLESAASENAARRRAMKAATDNADELMKILTRQANRARQDEITTEIMEIVGGAEALRRDIGGMTMAETNGHAEGSRGPGDRSGGGRGVPAEPSCPRSTPR